MDFTLVFQALVALAAAFLGGAGITALINAKHDRWRFSAEREAQLEDKAQEKADKLTELQGMISDLVDSVAKRQDSTDKRLEALDELNANQSQALKLLLLDRILHLGQAYIDRGWLTLDEYNNLTDLHMCYHDMLHGNGNADNVMKAVERLDVRGIMEAAESKSSQAPEKVADLKRELSTMDRVLAFMAIFLCAFVVVMVCVFVVCQAVPDTLIVSVFGCAGLECGVMGAIKNRKESIRAEMARIEAKEEGET